MKPPRTVNVTLDCLGVEIKAVFVRNEYNWKSPIAKTVAERCYQAAVRALASRMVPEGDTQVSVTRNGNPYSRRDDFREVEVRRMIRCKDFDKRVLDGDYSDNSELVKHFVLTVYVERVGDDKPSCTVNHEYLDWMFPEHAQVTDQALRLTHEKPTLPAATAARRVGSTAPGSLLALCDE